MDMKLFIRQRFNGQTRLVFSSKYKYFYIQSEFQGRKKYKGNLLSWGERKEGQKTVTPKYLNNAIPILASAVKGP